MSDELHIQYDDIGNFRIVAESIEGKVLVRGEWASYEGIAQLAFKGKLYVAVSGYYGGDPAAEKATKDSHLWMHSERIYELNPIQLNPIQSWKEHGASVAVQATTSSVPGRRPRM